MAARKKRRIPEAPGPIGERDAHLADSPRTVRKPIASTTLAQKCLLAAAATLQTAWIAVLLAMALAG